MPTYTVHLMTSACSWTSIEAPDAELAIQKARAMGGIVNEVWLDAPMQYLAMEEDELLEDHCLTCEKPQSECECGDFEEAMHDEAVHIDLHGCPALDCPKCAGEEADALFYGGK